MKSNLFDIFGASKKQKNKMRTHWRKLRMTKNSDVFYCFIEKFCDEKKV